MPTILVEVLDNFCERISGSGILLGLIHYIMRHSVNVVRRRLCATMGLHIQLSIEVIPCLTEITRKTMCDN